MKVWIYALISLLAIVGRVSDTGLNEKTVLVDETSADERDIAIFQRALISISRRLDSIEATLGGLAAVELIALTYIIEKIPDLDSDVWMKVAFGLLSAAVGIAVMGVLLFQGDDVPNLVDFAELRRENRAQTIKEAISAIVESWAVNKEQIRNKEILRVISALAAGVAVALTLLHVLKLGV